MDTSNPPPVSKQNKRCDWVRAFDGHFNISCETGERANGNFKGKEKGAKWEFEFCPYCGMKINELINNRKKEGEK